MISLCLLRTNLVGEKKNGMLVKFLIVAKDIIQTYMGNYP
jgi:hypothetical protein